MLTSVDVCHTARQCTHLTKTPGSVQVSGPNLYKGLQVFQDTTDQTRSLHTHIHRLALPMRMGVTGHELEEGLAATGDSGNCGSLAFPFLKVNSHYKEHTQMGFSQAKPKSHVRY